MNPTFALIALSLFNAAPLFTPESSRPMERWRIEPRPDELRAAFLFDRIAYLSPAVHDSIPGWDTAPLPRWQVRRGGQTHYLIFEGKKDLEELAARLRRGWVQVRGRLEQRAFTLGRLQPPGGGAVTDDGRMVTLTVLVVESLEETELELARASQSTRMTVRAEIRWQGNAYGRTPDGQVIRTLKGYAWEGCYIVVDGRTIRVRGLPGDMVVQQNYRGQTLTLVGRLVRQAANPAAHPDVLIVEEFRRE
jgi:hypothetical protein